MNKYLKIAFVAMILALILSILCFFQSIECINENERLRQTVKNQQIELESCR